ncbi:MAG: tetratricopeptide repeat protein [Anaerolineales bacterium]|nr:tetratricopeptide repeat protein [Anaerolineales bacterium]
MENFPASNPLLATKLYIPQERANWVARERLLHCLDGGLSCKLTLLSAPAGFGKTTLLAEWAGQLGERARLAWLSLDAGDNDIQRFLAYMFAALQRVEPGLGEVTSELLQPLQAGAESLLGAILNRIDQLAYQLVLALDDYHLVEAQDVHAAVGYLLEHQPPHFHLVISTRADPHLHLARLRGHGQLNELRLADLRFTSQEAAAFLNQVMGLSLMPSEIEALTARTEGWIAGLQMAAVSMRGREERGSFIQSFTGSNRFVLDYLSEEVLQRQPEDMQDFLLHTSILERLNGPLCDTVRGDSGRGQAPAAEILEHMERANLFVVPLDDRREWYRYHQLFADLLQKRLLKQQPELAPELHRRASCWFELNGWLAEAIRHSLAAADYERAAQLVEEAAEATLMRSEVATLLGWLEQLPEAQVSARPGLAVYHAWALLLSGRPSEKVLARLEELGPQAGALSAKAIPLHAYLALFRGDMSLAMQLSRQAFEHLDESDSYLRNAAWLIHSLSLLSEGDLKAGMQAIQQTLEMSLESGNTLVSVLTLCSLADNYKKLGQLRKAREIYQQALEMAAVPGGGWLPVGGRALVGLSDILREWNELEQAEKLALDGIALMEDAEQAGSFQGYVCLARIRQAQGDLSSALEAIQRARQLALAFDASVLDDLIAELVYARLAIAQGDYEVAMRWVEERSLLGETPPSHLDPTQAYIQAHFRKYEQMIAARLWLAQARPEQALRTLETVLPQFEKLNRPWMVIEIHVYMALALQALDDERRALEALEKALVLAEPEEYMRTFLDEGREVALLLIRLRNRGATQVGAAYIHKLLTAFGEKLPAEPPEISPTGSGETISERELEVLRLLNSELSSAEIADELFVSVHTVRSHIKSIYQKLGVHSRYQALVKAKKMNLI